MKNKLTIYLILLLFTYSCTGLGSKRSQKSDEFLVEKKNPLVMPPDIGELPSPEDSNNDKDVNSDSSGSELEMPAGSAMYGNVDWKKG